MIIDKTWLYQARMRGSLSVKISRNVQCCAFLGLGFDQDLYGNKSD